MPAKVTVRDLHKRYGAVSAVRGVSFEIQAGEIFGLLGPNGAGKTTTLECMIGLREPDGGTLEVCGFDVRRDPAEVKQRIGVALQSTSLQDQITPREALQVFGSFYRQRAAPAELLARFALEEKADARFDTLSGGQRQRLALALAFVNRPELVLLDEPTTGLDPQSRRELHGAIEQMKRDGYTVLLTTHYLEEAERLCDRIAIIDHGGIVATGSPRELISHTAGAQTITVTAARPLDARALGQLPAIQDVTTQGNTATFRSLQPTRTIAALMQWLDAQQNDLADLHVRKASLEDVFLRLTATSESHAA